MLSKASLERYRQMGPGGRFEIVMEALETALSNLVQGPPDFVERRFKRIRQLNDEHNQRLLERLAAAEASS